MSQRYFECSICNISLPIVYKGRNPPFLPGMQYTEDVFIMEEQSNDSMAVPVGGICCVCKQPCCLLSSCSVMCDNKRYCIHHLPN